MILNKLKHFLTVKILSPYLVFTFFYLKVLLQQLTYDWFETFVTYAVCIILIKIGLKLLIKIFNLNPYKTSYFVTIGLSLAFFLFTLVKSFNYYFPNIKAEYIIIVIFLILILLFTFIIKRNSNLLKFNYFLSLVFLIFCLIETYNYLNIYFRLYFDTNKNTIAKVAQIDNPPNVYILIIDGYANNKSLEKYWNYDNSDFTNKLYSLGFKIIPNSKSNYMFTTETLASMLNFNYLPKLKDENSSLIMNEMIDNEFINLFNQNNYHIFNLSLVNFKNCDFSFEPNFYVFKRPKSIFHSIYSKLPFVFIRTISIKKFLNYIRKKNIPNEIGGLERRRIKNIQTISKLDSISKLNHQKKLTVLHYMSLHLPYENEELNKMPLDSFLVAKKKTINTLNSERLNALLLEYYLTELKKATDIFYKSVENIIRNDKNSVILLMSDHGFRFVPGYPRSESDKESYMNFEAIYLPRKKYTEINDEITPINLMRLIANYSIGTNYKMLENKQIISKIN